MVKTPRIKKLGSPQQDRQLEDKGQDNETCELIEKEAYLQGKKIKVLFDSDATGNYISERIIRNRKILTWKKDSPYKILMFNNNENPHNNGWVTQEIQLQALQIGTHLEEISFDITNTGKYDIILGQPWHRKYNPTIDWITEDIDFDRCLCHHRPGWEDRIKVITRKQINAKARKIKQVLTIDYWKGDG